MVYRWPRSLLSDMERAMRNFLWSGSTQRQAPIRVSWSKCCAPKAEGGLGIRSLMVMNEALGCKLAWDVLNITDAPLLMICHLYFLPDCRLQGFSRFSSIWTGYVI